MECGFKLLPKQGFKEEVSNYLRSEIQTYGGKNLAKMLNISYKYLIHIAYEEGTPIHNMSLCMDIINLKGKDNYYAAVVPEKIVGKDLEYGLGVFMMKGSYVPNTYSSSKVPIFKLNDDVYKEVVNYWRRNLYDGTSPKYLQMFVKLTDSTLYSAVQKRISPRCSTVQKILGMHHLRMVILEKPGKGISGGHIKILSD